VDGNASVSTTDNKNLTESQEEQQLERLLLLALEIKCNIDVITQIVVKCMNANSQPKHRFLTKTIPSSIIKGFLYPERHKLLVTMQTLLNAIIRPANASGMAISAASIATSVPVPMAIPTSAWANATASLIPSPTKATLPVVDLTVAL
jgi:hypothetical protein